MKFEIVNDSKVYNNKTKIKVVGVGGGGGNAVNNMISSKLAGVDFVVANTDSQDIDRSSCSDTIQLGPSITMGLGAGADPEIGQASAYIHDIKPAGQIVKDIWKEFNQAIKDMSQLHCQT